MPVMFASVNNLYWIAEGVDIEIFSVTFATSVSKVYLNCFSLLTYLQI